MISEPIKYPEWRELFERVKDSEYGTSFSHDEIARIIRHPVSSAKYYSTISRCNRHLHQFANRHLDSVHKQGYRLIKPTEFLRTATRYVQQGVKRINRGYEVGCATPIHLLDEGDKQKHTAFMERGLRLRAMVDMERRELRAIASGKIVLSTDRQRMF